MVLQENIKRDIQKLLIKAIKNKIENYKPETKYRPFHDFLLGNETYALFSFIHSINTSIGISVWEQVAKKLANTAGYVAENHLKLEGEIDSNTKTFITDLHDDLKNRVIPPNYFEQLENIRSRIQPGRPIYKDDQMVDFFIKIPSDTGFNEFYFDITSPKDNKKEFSALKLKLLKWTAVRLSQKPDANVFACLAIPYNPHFPKKYDRWTTFKLFDETIPEIFVGKEFWNFVANDEIYEDLTEIFREAGKTLKPELEQKYAEILGR